MNLKFRLVTLLLSLMFLSACGSENYISLFDRRLGSSQGQTINNPSDEGGLSNNTPDDNNQEPDNSQPLLFDKVLENSDVSEQAVINAFEYFDENHEEFENQEWITIFDIKKHSGQKRFYVINMKTGDVKAVHTAHGKNSDSNHDGYATNFSNKNGSNQSSLGFMKTAETYNGKYKYSLRLDGLEDRNDNVRARAIVIHGANYVNSEWSKMGRSLGCPALDWDIKDWVVDRIKGGSLFYIYHEDYDS